MMAARWLLPWIRPTLVEALTPAPLPMAPTGRRALRQFNGKHPVVRPATGPQDALIMEVRRLHEQALLPAHQIIAHLAELGHSVTPAWVRQTLNYYNRSHLVPALGSDSYLDHPSESLV